MSTYTKTGNDRLDRWINDKIREDLNLITTRVAALLGNDLHSLLLCGGFGRGEGSVVVDRGQVHIVNDYDFTVVLNSKNRVHYVALYKKHHAGLERLAGELAHILDVKQVDLSPKPLSYFTKDRRLRIENYEVRAGHVLLYGNADPTRFMPDWKPEDIPLFEGIWLFRNRGTGLLLAALYFMTSGRIEPAVRENFIIECNKAVLAMGDAVLLLKKSYHHLYSRRREIMETLELSGIPDSEKLRSAYLDALDQKLHPDFERFSERDLIAWWFDVVTDYNRFFTFFERHRLGTEFDGWIGYADMEKPEDRTDIKTLAVKMIRAGRSILDSGRLHGIWRRSRKSFSITLIPLVVFSLFRDGYDAGMIGKAAGLLGVTLSGNPYRDWMTLAKNVLAEIHPGGEVGRFLSEQGRSVNLNDMESAPSRLTVPAEGQHGVKSPVNK